MLEMIAEGFSDWLIHYGSFALFALLVLGIIALPVAEDSLLLFAGVMVNQGLLYPVPTVVAAISGSIVGITISYLLGRTTGEFLVKNYGAYIGLTETRMTQLHWWFARFGKWLLFFGYFLPGIRHFTGIFAGLSELEYPVFALFAYSGAIVWVMSLLSIGYFFGNCCAPLFDLIEDNIDLLVLGALVAIGLWIIIQIRYTKSNKS